MTDETDDAVTVVCMRVDRSGIYVVPGSTIGLCVRCGGKVWVAQSTHEIKAWFGTPRQYVCTRCVTDDEMGVLGEAFLRGVEPEQRDELARYQDDIERYFRA